MKREWQQIRYFNHSLIQDIWSDTLNSNQGIKIFPTKQKLERHCSIPHDTRPFSPISIYVQRGLKQLRSIPFTHATTLISYVYALHGDSIRYLVNSSHVLPTLYRKHASQEGVSLIAETRGSKVQRNWSSMWAQGLTRLESGSGTFSPGLFSPLRNLNTLPYPNMYVSSGPSWHKHPPALERIFSSSPFSMVIIYEPGYFSRGASYTEECTRFVVRKNLKDRLKGEMASNRIFISVLEYEVEWLDWNVWGQHMLRLGNFLWEKIALNGQRRF